MARLPSRHEVEHRFREHKVIIQNNVGGGGRYSVEVSGSLTVIGTCNTLSEAESLIEDWIEYQKETAGDA